MTAMAFILNATFTKIMSMIPQSLVKTWAKAIYTSPSVLSLGPPVCSTERKVNYSHTQESVHGSLILFFQKEGNVISFRFRPK